MCNVPIQLNGDVLAAFFSEYGDIEDIITSKSSSGTAHGDYIVTMSLNRKGFQATPQTLDYEEQTMMVIVEGRKPQCWFCKELGHFSRPCPQKTTKTTVTPPTATTTTTTTTTTIAAKITPADKRKPTIGSWGPPRQRGGGVDPGNRKKEKVS